MKMCCFGKPKFLNELFQKLKSRRNEDDDGLPSSPVTGATTQDVLNDFKKPIDKRHASKNSVDSSMYSSEDELEDKNVFDQEWTTAVSGSRQNISGMSDSTENLDLNVVTSTTSLVSDVARHKIAVKPKNVRPSTQHRRPVKSPAPKALPQLEEREETKVDDSDARSSKGSLKVDAKVDRQPSPKAAVRGLSPGGSDERLSTSRSDVSEENPRSEIKVKADVESPAQRKRQSDSSKAEEEESHASEDEEHSDEETTPKPEESPKPVTMVIPKAEPRSGPPPLSPKPKKKEAEVERPVSEGEKEEKVEVVKVKDAEKKEPEKKEPEVERTPAAVVAGTGDTGDDAKPFNVVLRKTGRRSNIEEMGTIRMRDNAGDRDPSKRQTIAGDAGLTTIFGDRKAGQRNSFIEAARSPEAGGESAGENEFSQVLNRLKKQPSRKKLIPQEEGSDQKGERKTSVEKPVVVESKPKVVVDTKPVVVESSKPKVVGGPQKAAEGKPKPPEGKPKISDSKPKISETKPKISENKPKISETKPKIAETKPKIAETKPKISESKPIVISPKPVESKPEEIKPKETVIVSKTPETPKPKEKETVVIVKKEEPLKAKEPEAKRPSSPVATSTPLKAEPSSEAKRPTEPTTPTTPTPTSTTTKPEPTKAVVIEKARPSEPPKKAIIIQKSDPKTTTQQQPPPPKSPSAAKDDPKPDSFKRESPLVKNRVRSQTLTDQPVTAAPPGANKENEKGVQRSNSQGDAVEERPKPTTTTPKTPTDAPPTTPAAPKATTTTPGGGRTAEPAWFNLARKKTANWDQKERDLEQKERKDTSNQAEKERDAASTKVKDATPVGLTIDEVAKEESKPALRNTVKCSNSAANRQSKVLDMAKLFQNQVS